jgi:ribosomal protein L28
MAAVCDICGKKPWFGKAVTACMSCIKAGKVVRAARG